MSKRPIVSRTVRYVTAEHAEQREIQMLIEAPLYLWLNGQQIAVLMRLPGQDRELAIGFCLSEGIITGTLGLVAVREQGLEDGALSVMIEAEPESVQKNARLDIVRLVRAGTGAIDLDRSQMPLECVSSHRQFEAKHLLALDGRMRDAQWLRRQVGGVHAAALFDTGGQLVVVREDVGRHNAVDKVVGYCFVHGISLDDKVLLCSGRLSYEMVTKAIRIGIPILASISTPTALAVEIARRFNLTLVGYLRDGHLSVYAHPWRVLGANDAGCEQKPSTRYDDRS